MIAMDLWRNNDLSKHPKGSCSGCHGPDFIDLAVMGSTDDDIVRRAKIDGATDDEADALVQAVDAMRREYSMAEQDARSFRPFQPGGAVLLPDLQDEQHIANVKRDIAFGEQLEDILPSWFGAPIETLEDAQQARDELLDLLSGTNWAGANPRNMQLRDLPVGMEYPLWSADLHHGAEEGTLNDWLADIARDSTTETQEEWLEIQQTYLDNPSRENFWRMYEAAERLTEPQLLGNCTMTGINRDAACDGASSFVRDKFFSALIGQHMLRQPFQGYDSRFIEGPLGFSYLDDTSELSFMLDRKDPEMLPANLWEIGDMGRKMLINSRQDGTFRQNLDDLGFPDFVQDSIDSDRSAFEEQHDLRLIWFWIGFTFDPSFARIGPSNATNSGEYMVETFYRRNFSIHNAFSQNTRLVAHGFIPEANVVSRTRPNRVEQVEGSFSLNYRYFTKYGREVLRWTEDANAGTEIPQTLKDEQEELWHTFTANGFRVSLHLYLEALQDGGPESNEHGFDAIKNHFDTYEPENQVADYALLNAVRNEVGEADYAAPYY